MTSSDAQIAQTKRRTEIEVVVADDALALEAMLDSDHPRKRAAAEWARRNLDDHKLLERDESCTFWHDGFQRVADEGLLGMLVEPERGGRGLDLCSALLTLEGLGLGCRDDGLVFALSSQILTMQLTLQRFGSEDQVDAWLPQLISGQKAGAFAMSEPGSGSDAYSLTTRAERTQGGYTLNGEKAWITMAPIADVFIIFATTNAALGRWGISAFLVPADTEGLTVGPNRPKMGMRTTPFANVVLEGCRVPESARIGNEGAGASIFSAAMEPERGFLLIGGLGALERSLHDAIGYAKEREQFGQPIGAFQAVSHAISEVKLGLESSRLLVYKAAALQQRGTPSMLVAALAKLATSEAALQGALTNLEIQGARGYVSEYGVERDVRNAAGGVIYGGASGIQKNIIARLLGLPA